VEIRGEARGVLAERIQRRINVAERRFAVSGPLFIGESQVAGPKGRRKTGPAIVVGRAGFLVGADVIGEIRVGRHVRAVAIGCGATGAGIHGRLPGGNRNLGRRNAASAVRPAAFRRPGAAGAAGGQVRPAHRHDIIHTIRRPSSVGRRPLAIVAGRRKEVLTLHRELLKVRVVRCYLKEIPAEL
jgi:hypothetical protein